MKTWREKQGRLRKVQAWPVGGMLRVVGRRVAEELLTQILELYSERNGKPSDNRF